MRFDEAQERLSKIRQRLHDEIQLWKPLTEALVARENPIEEQIAGFAADQEKNMSRLQGLAGRFRELGAINPDVVGDQMMQQMNAWRASLDIEMTSVRDRLETLVPVFALSQQPLDDAVQQLKQQFDEKSAALTEAMSDRLGEAQGQIEENLTNAATALATSVDDMSEGITEALNEVRELLEEAWNEARENITENEGALSEQGADLRELLDDAVTSAVDKVTGELGSLSETVDGLLSGLRRTLDNVERTIETVGEITEGTSIGLKGASVSLDTARQIISSVA